MEQKTQSDILSNLISIHVIQEHTKLINSLLLLNDKRIASCSCDQTIKIYSPLNNYKCDITLSTPNSEEFQCIFQLSDNVIISSSNNQRIHFWSITQNDFTCLFTIND